jgi:phosphate uptake regulator
LTKFIRRLQRIGSTTLVSLPKEWVDANNLTKGSEVHLDANQNTLMITTTEDSRQAKDLTIYYPLPKEENVVADITGAYLLGYDLIQIKSEKSIPIKDRDNIRNSMRRLVGMEIVEEDATTVTMQFILDSATLNPQKILKRMSTIVLGMFDDILNALILKDQNILQTLSSRDNEVNRQYFLLVRLIRNTINDKKLASAFNLENIDILDYRVAANILEITGDTIVELSQALLKTQVASKDLKQIYHVSNNFSQMETKAIDAFVNNDRRLAIEAITIHKNNQSEISSLRNSLQNKSQIPIDFLDILYMFDRIERSWADIADLVKPIYSEKSS